MRKIDECGVEKFGTLDSSEKTTAILGDRWWPQTAKLLEVSPLGVATVLRLERDAWSMVKMTKASNK